MRTPRRLVLLLLATALGGCPPSTRYTDGDVPKLPKLGDVMWAQAQACDPAFKHIGKTGTDEHGYAEMTACAQRLQLTTARIKSDFSKGPEFNQLADSLASHAQEVAAAAQAKDEKTASLALQATKDTCKACHSKFR